jgi:aspartate aminotransferase
MKKVLRSPLASSISMPENLRIGLMVNEHRRKCRTQICDFDYYGLAFGESPFPVPDMMKNSLAHYADQGQYVPADGLFILRQAIGHFTKRHFKFEVDPERIVITNGVKNALSLIVQVMNGAFVVPSPAWVGYMPIIKAFSKTPYVFHLEKGSNYKIDPEKLDHFLKMIDEKQIFLVLNNPHNPTGAVYSKSELERIAYVCRKHGVYVIADEIYALTTYDMSKFCSMAKIYPEGTFLLNGVSKDRSSGGWRLGYIVLPPKVDPCDFKKMIATLYTNVSTPIQFAAVSSFEKSQEMDEYFKVARDIHRIMCRFLSNRFNEIDGVDASFPDGGFYFFADFNEFKKDFIRKSVKKSNDLMFSMISHPFHIALVSGDTCLLDEGDFGARIACVDYDGADACVDYLANPPKSRVEEIDFVRRNAPRLYDVKVVLEKYIEFILS